LLLAGGRQFAIAVTPTLPPCAVVRVTDSVALKQNFITFENIISKQH
jgi:hypothetical protein